MLFWRSILAKLTRKIQPGQEYYFFIYFTMVCAMKQGLKRLYFSVENRNDTISSLLIIELNDTETGTRCDADTETFTT